MPATETDPMIPEDLADALRRAAAAVPPADLHPSGPVLRLQARRRRHRLAVTVGSVAAAVIAVAAVNIAVGDDTNEPVVTGTNRDVDPSSPKTPAEHGLTTPLFLPGTWAELLPDGTERDLPKAQPDDIPIGRPARLEDGRLVSLSTRTSGPNPLVLSVFDTQGELLIERDIHRPERTPQLIGAHDGKAVLARTPTDPEEQPQMDVVTIDLVTFEETPLTTANLPGLGSVAGGRLVLGNEQCSLKALDLAAGSSGQIDLESCARIHDLAVSPTGRYVAVIVEQGDVRIDATGSPAMQIIDLQSGEVVAVKALWDTCAGREGCDVTTSQAITWEDEDTAAVVVLITDASGTVERHIDALDVE